MIAIVKKRMFLHITTLLGALGGIWMAAGFWRDAWLNGFTPLRTTQVIIISSLLLLMAAAFIAHLISRRNQFQTAARNDDGLVTSPIIVTPPFWSESMLWASDSGSQIPTRHADGSGVDSGVNAAAARAAASRGMRLRALLVFNTIAWAWVTERHWYEPASEGFEYLKPVLVAIPLALALLCGIALVVGPEWTKRP
jgi:hypothetical protein